MKVWKHFCTITNHKWLVMKHCFKAGLYWQGITHDLSKYGYTEFSLGCKYYLGTESPHNGERREYGFSKAWLHHKGCNKHHLEYWMDYAPGGEPVLAGVKMPKKYVVEMFIDRVCASKNYQKEAYTDASAWEYYNKGRAKYLLYPETREFLEELLLMLKEKGEKATFSYIRNTVLKIDFKY